jgi:hypothetical protein
MSAPPSSTTTSSDVVHDKAPAPPSTSFTPMRATRASTAWGMAFALTFHGVMSHAWGVAGFSPSMTTTVVAALVLGVVFAAVFSVRVPSAERTLGLGWCVLAATAASAAFVQPFGVHAVAAQPPIAQSVATAWAPWAPALAVAPWFVALGMTLGASGIGFFTLATATDRFQPALLALASCGGALLATVCHGRWHSPLVFPQAPLVLVALGSGMAALANLRRAQRVALLSSSSAPFSLSSSLSPKVVVAAGVAAAPAAGFVALAEHLTDATLGASTVAGAVVLAVVLVSAGVGIGIGRWPAFVGSVRAPVAPASAFVATALAVSWAALLWDRMPGWLADGARLPSFAAAEAWRFACVTLLLGPAVTSSAAAFCLSVGARHFVAEGHGNDDGEKNKPDEPARRRVFGASVLVGAALGAGVGVLGMLDVLVPAVGSRAALTLLTLVLLGVASAWALAHRRTKGSDPVVVWAAAVTWATVAVLLPDWRWAAFASVDPTSLRGRPHEPRARVVAHSEDLRGGVWTKTTNRPSRKKRRAGAVAVTTLRRDGVVVAADKEFAQRAAAQCAHLGLRHSRGRQRAFVAADAPFALVQALRAGEMAVVDVASSTKLDRSLRLRGQRFDRAVVVHHEEASDALSRARGTYDLVVVDLPPLSHARTERMATQRLWSQAQLRLARDGAFLLTFELAGTEPALIADLLRDVRAWFSAVSLFAIGGRGVVVGRSAFDVSSSSSPAALASSLSPPSPLSPSGLAALAPSADSSTAASAAEVLSNADVDTVLAAHEEPGWPRLRFGVRAAAAAWRARSARGVVSDLLRLVEPDESQRRIRLDRIFPPRASRSSSASSFKKAGTKP